MTLKNKAKDMSRSVLPSTSRKRSREMKRNAHKECRARVRAALHDWDEDSTDELLDPQRYALYRGVKVVVSERREADKVNPLMHWAEATADRLGDTPQERYKALRAMLPPGIIGWHAMSHVEFLEPFHRGQDRWWRYRPTDLAASRRRAKARRAALCEALKDSADRFGALNDHLKTLRRSKLSWDHESGLPVWTQSIPIRPLLGVHDVEDFIAELPWSYLDMIDNFLTA